MSRGGRPSHAGVLSGRNVGRLGAGSARGNAPDIDEEAILELMVHYGSLEFAFRFEQGVATATYDSFHDAFADVPASASRASSQRSFHTCWPGSPDPRW